MAQTKSSGSTSLGRDSRPKYLGIKIGDGQAAKTGQILVRQRGTRFVAGQNVAMGGDNTLYALKAGTAQFHTKTKKGYDRSRKHVGVVSVISSSK